MAQTRAATRGREQFADSDALADEAGSAAANEHTSPRVMTAFSLAGLAFGLFYVAWFLFAYDEPHAPMVAVSIATSALFASGLVLARTRFATAGAIVIVTLACIALLAYTSVLTTDSDVHTLYLAAGFGMLALVPERMWRLRIGYAVVIVLLALSCKFIFPSSDSMTAEDLAREDFVATINRMWTVAVIVLAMTTVLYRSTRRHRDLSGAAKRGEQRANTDPMTGIANRRPVITRVNELDAEAVGGYAVALIDIDSFKVINDRLGHEEGDELISAIARRLKEHFRASDVVSRWGGDEFLIVLEGVGEDDLVAILERLRESVSRSPFALGADPIHVTLSIGAAVADPGVSGHAMINAADAALYTAKHTGRNRVVLAASNTTQAHRGRASSTEKRDGARDH